MNTSQSIQAIAPALLKAQKAIGSVKKSSKNFYKSSYATLESVMEVVKKPLNDNDIVILQPVAGDKVETVLLHTSGEWLASETPIVSAKPSDPQAQGSAITYARRYGLMAMIFIPAEDDDGEAAVNRSTQPTQSPQPKKAYTPTQSNQEQERVEPNPTQRAPNNSFAGTASLQQNKMFFAVAKEKGIESEKAKNWAKKKFALESFADISGDQISKAIELISTAKPVKIKDE